TALLVPYRSRHPPDLHSFPTRRSSDLAFGQPPPADVALSAIKDWKVLGASIARPNGREIVTGQHQYPSDIIRPGMLRGRILRPRSEERRVGKECGYPHSLVEYETGTLL